MNPKRTLITVLMFIGAMLICPSGYGQQNPPGQTQEDQDLQDQMREMMGTIFQNMRDKNVDPGQFFQQMRDGADPADIQKQMVDQGIIDQKTADQLQTTTQKLRNNNIKEQLGVTDDEWKALEPLIQKVITTSSSTGGPGMGPMGGFMTGQTTDAAKNLGKAKRAMAAALKDPATTPEQFTAALKTVRDARDAAKAESTAAQKELLSVLTVRQEGVLASMGIID